MIGRRSPAAESADLLRALHEEYALPLLRYVMRIVQGDRGRAEDLVQETLLRAWQHPEALEPERGDPGAWLYTVARHLAIDQLRTGRARLHEVSASDLDGALLEAQGAGDSDIDRVIETWELGDALLALTPEHRAVLMETFYRGRTVAQAGAALGIPAGTVKSRTYYALRALKLALVERGVSR